MKLLKPLLLSAFLGASMGAFSTAALAETDEGRITFTPQVAIANTVAKIMEARHAIDNGADSDAAVALITEAIDLNKEINANDIVDSKRQRAATHLKKAKSAAKKSELQVAEEQLKEAEQKFKELPSFI
ncbi:MAG: hypothetical protein IBX55_09465 [Methyloprofundus sp.]|nr:hypothetical protein [Methyloprofundus sp.]